MSKTTKKNEEILEEFLASLYETSTYWADVKLTEIAKRESLVLYPAEQKALATLIATDTGKEALRVLLVDCARSNIFTILDYIDGGTGVRPLDLVNAETGELLTEGALHEEWTAFEPSSSI